MMIDGVSNPRSDHRPGGFVKGADHLSEGEPPGASATSRTLLARVQRQDAHAWTELCDLYTPLVRWWCARQAVHAADVADLVQEVFLTVVGRVQEFHHGERRGSFRAWLRQITAFKVLEYRRRRGPAAEGGTDANERLTQVAEPAPEEEETERAIVVRVAVEHVRRRVEAHTFEAATRTLVGGEPTEVVAASLGMTSAAVLVAKSRFLNKLREELGELLD
jgi:RNA polymerase sigma-70 factor (ECF subfamily)